MTDTSPISTIIICLAFLTISFLYSSVGHGGATGYLAVLSFTNRPAAEISTTALILNVITASISFSFYYRAGHFRWRLALPFIAASIPAALLGAMVPLREQTYGLILAFVLLATAGKLFADSFGKSDTTAGLKDLRPAVALVIGAFLGLVSGMVGIGGGVFLSPVLMFMRWADAKQTSAVAAIFIIANSVSGLIGRAAANKLTIGPLAPLLVSSLVGAILGSYMGARKFSANWIRRALSVVLLVAVAKLLVTHS